MTVALTVYPSTVANGSPLTTSGACATTTGGTNGSNTTKTGTLTNWGQVYALGNGTNWPQLGSIGAADGNGWLLNTTLLELQQFVSGNWTPTMRFNMSAGTLTADIHFRVFKRSSGGVYTQLGSDFTLTTQSFSGTQAQYAFSAQSIGATVFDIGDKLYFDVWLKITAGGSSGASIRAQVSTSSTQGYVNANLVTPGYNPLTALLIQGHETFKTLQKLAIQGQENFKISQKLSATARDTFLILQKLRVVAQETFKTRQLLRVVNQAKESIRQLLGVPSRETFKTRQLLRAPAQETFKTRQLLSSTTRATFKVKQLLRSVAESTFKITNGIRFFASQARSQFAIKQAVIYAWLLKSTVVSVYLAKHTVLTPYTAKWAKGASMPQPFSTTITTAAVTNSAGTPQPGLTATLVVTFPDGSLSSTINPADLGNGSYQAVYTTKAPGLTRELWTFVNAGATQTAQFQNDVGVTY